MTNHGKLRTINTIAGWIAIALLAGIVVIVPSVIKTNMVVHEFAGERVLLYSSTSFKQAWNHTWGGSSDDFAQAATNDNAGNGYIAGATESFGPSSENAFFARYDSSGKQTLNRTWGISGKTFEVWGITVDDKGNIYVTGLNATGSIESAFVFKFDSTGTQMWNETWGHTGITVGYGITVDGNGNVYMAATTNVKTAGGYDALVAKYSSTGMLDWNHTWGGTNDDNGQGIGVDASDNVYITGATKSFGDPTHGDAFIAKFTSTGSLLWNHTWGGANYEYGYSIAVNASENAWITGYTMSFGAGSDDAFLVSYNSAGTQLWNRTWGYSGSAENGIGVAVDGSGNAYITGDMNHIPLHNFDVFLAKYDPAGTQLWNCTWGGTGADSGYGVGVDPSGTIIVGGYTNSFGAKGEDALILKYIQPPVAPVLASISSPSTTGNIALSWSIISSATNYSVYRATSTITSVAFLTPITTGLTATTYADNGLENGMYYYVVIATNSIGSSPISNCEAVTVAISPSIPSPPGIPGYLVSCIMASIAPAVVILMVKHRRAICSHQAT